MSVIIDTLILGPKELDIIKRKYLKCQTIQLTDSDHMVQYYQITIYNENEEDYYIFLLKNSIAMSSKNYYSRIKNGIRYADRIKATIAKEE